MSEKAGTIQATVQPTMTQGSEIPPQVGGSEARIKPAAAKISIGKTNSGQVFIKQGEVEAVSSQKINVMESKVYMETSSGVKEINVLPEEISSSMESGAKLEKMELKEQEKKPVYSVTSSRPARLLFIVPVSVKAEMQISADSGDIISIKKPWWSFMAW